MTARAHAHLLFASIMILASCDQKRIEEEPAVAVSAPGVSPYVGSDTDLDLVTGQTVFVPAYTEILVGRERMLPFTTSLAIHNAALSEPLVVKSVRHYDTDGQLVKEYVEKPLQLAPLATKVLYVEKPGAGGGAGANFIVEWASETAIYEPVVEALMVTSSGTQGFSLISPGRVLKQSE